MVISFLRDMQTFGFLVCQFQKRSDPEVFFKKVVLRNRLWRSCFLVNFAKFLGTPFVTEHLQWLLLQFFTFLDSAMTHLWLAIFTRVLSDKTV